MVVLRLVVFAEVKGFPASAEDCPAVTGIGNHSLCLGKEDAVDSRTRAEAGLFLCVASYDQATLL